MFETGHDGLQHINLRAVLIVVAICAAWIIIWEHLL
jgi:hypothetical protein